MQRRLKDDEWLQDTLFGAAEMQQCLSKMRSDEIFEADARVLSIFGAILTATSLLGHEYTPAETARRTRRGLSGRHRALCASPSA